MDTSSLSLPRIVTVDNEVLPARWAEFFDRNRAKLHVVLLYENDAQNGKLWPATEIIMRGIARGDHGTADTVIDSTSGNYGVALAVVIRQAAKNDPSFPIKRVVAVVPRSLPQGKRKRLLEQDIELIDAADSLDAMRVAKLVAEERGYWYTKQYWNQDNTRGYWRIGNYLAERLPDLGMVAWGVGSGGGCSGIAPTLSLHFKNRQIKNRPFPLWRVGVVVEDGESVGGVRGEKALEPGSLEWRAPNIDDVRFVGGEASLRFSAALWRQSETSPETACLGGPSTGFACEGAGLAARNLVIMRRFDEFRAPDGFVHILAPSLDTRKPYRAEYEERGIYLPKSAWE